MMSVFSATFPRHWTNKKEVCVFCGFFWCLSFFYFISCRTVSSHCISPSDIRFPSSWPHRIRSIRPSLCNPSFQTPYGAWHNVRRAKPCSSPSDNHIPPTDTPETWYCDGSSYDVGASSWPKIPRHISHTCVGSPHDLPKRRDCCSCAWTWWIVFSWNSRSEDTSCCPRHSSRIYERQHGHTSSSGLLGTS